MTLFHEEKCTTCHTEAQFSARTQYPGADRARGAHMAPCPIAPFTPEETAKIHASVESCSVARNATGTDRLRQLAIKSPCAVTECGSSARMIAKPGSRISPDEAGRILRSVRTDGGILMGRGEAQMVKRHGVQKAARNEIAARLRAAQSGSRRCPRPMCVSVWTAGRLQQAARRAIVRRWRRTREHSL